MRFVSRRLNVKIHLLSQRCLTPLQLMNRDVLADLLPRNDLLVQNSRSSPLENIALLLLASLIRLDVTSLQCSLLLRDNRNVDVRSGTQIIENTSLDSVRCQVDSLLFRQCWLPLRLEDRHGCERTTSHGDIWKFVSTAVCMDSKQSNTSGVNSSYNEVCANVSLVPEQMLLEHGHACNDSRFAAGGK